MDVNDMQQKAVKAWAADRLKLVSDGNPNDDVMYRDLLGDYRSWCAAHGYQAWAVKGMVQFAAWLQFDVGIDAYSRRNANGPKWPVRHYSGARLRDKRDVDQVI